MQIAEETTKLVSLGPPGLVLRVLLYSAFPDTARDQQRQLEKLVEVFERSLLKLRKANLLLRVHRVRSYTVILYYDQC